MKTPIDATGMAGATVALINAGSDFAQADLYKITLNGGAVLRWSGAPVPLSFTSVTGAGGTYALGPPINRGKITTKLGLEVATLDMQIMANASDLINGVPIMPFAVQRGFDGASVVLYRAFMPDWASPITGVVIEFSGRITSIRDVGGQKLRITVSSWTVLLNTNVGPDVYQAACLNTHYDAACGLSPSNVAGIVAAGSWTANAFHSNLGNADHFFDKGIVTFTSGANNGLSRTCQTYLNAAGAMVFAFGFPTAPAAGDTFNAVRGCLLTMADCTAQSNLIHFRGTPFVPAAATGAVG